MIMFFSAYSVGSKNNGLAITVIASVDYAGSADFADSASSADSQKRGIAKTKKREKC